MQLIKKDKQQILEYLKFRACGMTFTVYEEEWKKLQEWRHKREKEFPKNSRRDEVNISRKL